MRLTRSTLRKLQEQHHQKEEEEGGEGKGKEVGQIVGNSDVHKRSSTIKNTDTGTKKMTGQEEKEEEEEQQLLQVSDHVYLYTTLERNYEI
jgi:hypothetical protein